MTILRTSTYHLQLVIAFECINNKLNSKNEILYQTRLSSVVVANALYNSIHIYYEQTIGQMCRGLTYETIRS